jgi:hypothetical protein
MQSLDSTQRPVIECLTKPLEQNNFFENRIITDGISTKNQNYDMSFRISCNNEVTITTTFRNFNRLINDWFKIKSSRLYFIRIMTEMLIFGQLLEALILGFN